MEGSPEAILDFERPLNIGLLDKVVTSFFSGDMRIQPILVQFQNHPKAWTRVDAILQTSQSQNTKMLALIILENTVKFRWNTLPLNQKKGIRTFIVSLIIKMSKSKEMLDQNTAFVTKLNIVLVQIVKQEWPHNWPSFIPELVNSSKSSESLCANNMEILKLLSEEVFDYSSGQMTQAKMTEMKKSLNREFTLIFQLCEYILENSQDAKLLTITLETLQRFLNWIPVGYIFETKLIETLALKFFRVPQFQNVTLQCLSEIGGIELQNMQQYNTKFVQLFVAVIEQVCKLLTQDTDVAKVYAQGDQSVQTFVRHLGIFITSFLKSHLPLLENGGGEAQQQVHHALFNALKFLLFISQVDDTVIWKICLEYWNLLVEDLYNTQRLQASSAPLMIGALHGAQQTPRAPRVQQYAEILSQLRLVMIAKMAKPEEVLIVEDENGEIVRETMPDTDAIILYKSMRDGLIYLTHLDPHDTQKTMLMKLSRQVDGSEWSWHNLNTLCWAIGSISGALTENQEKTFLVRVIKDLLGMCENKRGKDHKAVIASNIMYVVGQYPRFLRLHWRFLKTVVNKLFEFMHEKHPGVQDMSCDTFLKIARKCRRKFVVLQEDERAPFIEEILAKLPETIKDLEHSQIHTFYEAVAGIIKSESDPQRRQRLVVKLMELPNQTWQQIISQANHSVESLWNLKTVKPVIWVLKTNAAVASALEHVYMVQLGRIYLEMLQVYKSYSGFVSNEIKTKGPEVTRTVVVRSMRAVKKETLKLIQCFVRNAQNQDHETIFKAFLPALLEPVLQDYKSNVPAARDAEVLALLSEFIMKLGPGMVQSVGTIFESTFQCTLDMITKNFEDFPDVRKHFFGLLRAINSKCFPALLQLKPQQFKLIIDSIVWAFKHLERNISDIGLNTLQDLLRNVQNSNIANQFYKSYFIHLLQEVLGIVTDTFHKQGFRLHAAILTEMFRIVETGSITVPLWEQGQNFANNQTYVRQFAVNLISNSFKTIRPQQAEAFVAGAFNLCNNVKQFKVHVRDFLIQIKEFASDKEGLYAEERETEQAQAAAREKERIASVPGLAYTSKTQPQQAQVSQS